MGQCQTAPLVQLRLRGHPGFGPFAVIRGEPSEPLLASFLFWRVWFPQGARVGFLQFVRPRDPPSKAPPTHCVSIFFFMICQRRTRRQHCVSLGPRKRSAARLFRSPSLTTLLPSFILFLCGTKRPKLCRLPFAVFSFPASGPTTHQFGRLATPLLYSSLNTFPSCRFAAVSLGFLFFFSFR